MANEALSAHAAMGHYRGEDGPFYASLAQNAVTVEGDRAIMQIVTSTVRGSELTFGKEAFPL